MEHQWIVRDCLKVMAGGMGKIDLVIADPPYDNIKLINESISATRSVCDGPVFFFMYAEDIFHLFVKPDQVLFWCKQPSTKNTSKKYSRFVEAIVVYDLDKSPFNQDTHWTTRCGTFTDQLTYRDHEFQKPDSLMEKLVAVNSKPGDWVLDPFAGTGTVQRACEKLERNSLSIELNPKLEGGL